MAYEFERLQHRLLLEEWPNGRIGINGKGLVSFQVPHEAHNVVCILLLLKLLSVFR